MRKLVEFLKDGNRFYNGPIPRYWVNQRTEGKVEVDCEFVDGDVDVEGRSGAEEI